MRGRHFYCPWPDLAKWHEYMTVQVNIHEAKSQLSALIAKVIAGEQVTIAKAGCRLLIS